MHAVVQNEVVFELRVAAPLAPEVEIHRQGLELEEGEFAVASVFCEVRDEFYCRPLALVPWMGGVFIVVKAPFDVQVFACKIRLRLAHQLRSLRNSHLGLVGEE